MMLKLTVTCIQPIYVKFFDAFLWHEMLEWQI